MKNDVVYKIYSLTDSAYWTGNIHKPFTKKEGLGKTYKTLQGCKSSIKQLNNRGSFFNKTKFEIHEFELKKTNKVYNVSGVQK